MTDPAPVLDPTAIDRLSEMTGGDPEFIRELIATYLEDAEVQLAAMRTAVDASSAEDLVRPAHSLKSNSASMGATDLAEMCRSLEADARAGQLDGTPERVAAAASEFERVRVALTAAGDAL
jgi:HPt (histidine-containing phosphotransfer) domain-containing protein